MTVTVRLVLLALAIVCAAIFTVVGFDWVSVDHPFGWLGLAVGLGLASRWP